MLSTANRWGGVSSGATGKGLNEAKGGEVHHAACLLLL